MKKALLLSVVLTLVGSSYALAGQKEDMLKLAEQKGCLACHQIDKKVVGPAWLDVAKRYTEKDIDQLVNSILNGSMGKWGNVPMPANKGIVSEEEARKLAEWIISLKKKEGKKK